MQGNAGASAKAFEWLREMAEDWESREKSDAGDRGSNCREGNPAGAKALNCLVAITARLKPCPCYKTCTDGGPNEFFTKL